MTTAPSTSNSNSASPAAVSARDAGMDALRTLAVLGMMAAHTSRLIVPGVRPAWSHWVLLLEPLIPSLFLLLVGLSLARSLEKSREHGQAPRQWFWKQARRALPLWAISCAFFTLELGFRMPDALIASGILSNIAYAILIVSGLLALPHQQLGLTLALLVGTGTFVWLDGTGQRIFPLNIGNSPQLPLWLFALAGALWGITFRPAPFEKLRSAARRTQHTFRPAGGVAAGLLGIAGALAGCWLIGHYGLEILFAKPFGRSDAARWLAAPLTGGTAYYAAYYNLRPLLAAACLCLHFAALPLLQIWLSKVPEKAASRIFSIGRHALGAYILHLALLAILVVSVGARPLTNRWQGNAALAGIFLACLIWALWRERVAAKRHLPG